MELKEIDNSESGKRRLNEALHIYRTTILPEAQNPERQIVYWIDHSREALADEFRCFAIQHDREIIGYLQYSYFREEHIFFFEYLCIRDQKRAGLLPSTALQRIERYLSQHYAPDFTIAFEIAHKRETPGEWVSDKKLTTYFKSLGFRRIQFGYRYPILQSYDGGTSYPADLMVRLPKDRVEISSSEMRTLLRCIYFKHYLRWDRPFLSQERFHERERLINELYTQQLAQIGSTDNFSTDGGKRKRLRELFKNKTPSILFLLSKIFGPKLPRFIFITAVLLLIGQILGSVWLLIPLILVSSVVFCLAEDTTASRKLVVTIISKLSLGRLRMS